MKGITKYEKICNGTPKELCGDKKFISNGCISDKYNEGFEVKGTEWGTCGCDTDAGKYDTEEECKKNNTGKGCDSSNGCYQTCEALGHYSTEDACENGMSLNQVCVKVNSCYERQKNGFTIALKGGTMTRFSNASLNYNLNTSDSQFSLAKDINGITHDEILYNPIVYKAGKYKVCLHVNSINELDEKLEFSTLNEIGREVETLCYESNSNKYSGCLTPAWNDASIGTYDTLACWDYTFENGKDYTIGNNLSKGFNIALADGTKTSYTCSSSGSSGSLTNGTASVKYNLYTKDGNKLKPVTALSSGGYNGLAGTYTLCITNDLRDGYGQTVYGIKKVILTTTAAYASSKCFADSSSSASGECEHMYTMGSEQSCFDYEFGTDAYRITHELGQSNNGGRCY